MRVLKPNWFIDHRKLLDIYPILPDGRILSKADPTRALKATVHTSKGFVQVDVMSDNGQVRACVHVLVALMYLPIPKGKHAYTVNHKDGNKLNNHKDNLEWWVRDQGLPCCPTCGQPVVNLATSDLQSPTTPQ